jgi:hypothetical protein
MVHAWSRRGMRIGFWWESQKETNYYEDLSVDGSIILGIRWILERWDGMIWTGLIWLQSSCEHDNETSGSIKCCEILE